MKTINFYRQARVDGGRRTGIDIDGETVLEKFEPGNEPEDSALLWFVDIRFSGNQLPGAADTAREWLLKRTPLIQAGVREVADELRAGIDFSAPVSRDLARAGNGIHAKIFCSAMRRLPARDIAKALMDVSTHWASHLRKLEILEPLAR
jgi:hypothetical protein